MSNICHIKFIFVSLTLMFSMVCQAESNVESKQLTQIIEQLNLMQQELRLVTKEVVGLSAKLEFLEEVQIVAAKNSAPKPNIGPQSVLLDGKDYESPKLGSDDAQYAMIEFSDYECPYCRRYSTQVFPQIKQRYINTGKLQYVIRDFPLGFHSQAKPAAIAAHCAAEQSKFWEMSESLMKNSRQLSEKLYPKLAKEHGLDLAKFNDCLVSPKMKERINTDFSYGQSLGVNGTPRFFIGKIKGDEIIDLVSVTGSQPLQNFDRAIQQVMSK